GEMLPPAKRLRDLAWCSSRRDSDGFSICDQHRCGCPYAALLARHPVNLLAKAGIIQEWQECTGLGKPDRAMFPAHDTLPLQKPQIPPNGCLGCSGSPD